MNDINASLQCLNGGNKKCDDDTAATNDADRQQDPYGSAMLRSRHNKRQAKSTLKCGDGVSDLVNILQNI